MPVKKTMAEWQACNFVDTETVKAMRLTEYSPEFQKELRRVASEFIPDGGPLDDDWSDCVDAVAGAIENEWPELFDLADTDDLCNDLIGYVGYNWPIPLDKKD